MPKRPTTKQKLEALREGKELPVDPMALALDMKPGEYPDPDEKAVLVLSREEIDAARVPAINRSTMSDVERLRHARIVEAVADCGTSRALASRMADCGILASRAGAEATCTYPETGEPTASVQEALLAYVSWYREGLRIKRWTERNTETLFNPTSLAAERLHDSYLFNPTSLAAERLHDSYRDDVTNGLMGSIRDWATTLEPPRDLDPPGAPPPNVRPRYGAVCTVCYATLHVSYETEVREKGWRTLAVRRPYRSSRNPVHAWLCAECLPRVAELRDHDAATKGGGGENATEPRQGTSLHATDEPRHP